MPRFHAPERSLDRVIEIRGWIRGLQSDRKDQWRIFRDNGCTDPVELLEEFRRQMPGACRRFAYVMAAALICDGYHARVVHGASKISNESVGHTMAEVWLEDRGKWVIADAAFDVTYLAFGKPASLLDLHRLLTDGQTHEFRIEDHGVGRWPKILNKTEYLSQFHHVYVLQTMDIFQNRDGQSFWPRRRLKFIHLSDERVADYPSNWKPIALLLSAWSLAAGAISALHLVTAN